MFKSLYRRAVPYATRRDISTKIDLRNKIYFLHIGKTAGTALGLYFEQINKSNEKIRFVKLSHSARITDIPYEAPYFFSTREPVSRFKSAFYSRKRKGAPRNYNEWTSAEKKAFSQFEHANDLAESLFQTCNTRREAANAICSIQHICQPQWTWFAPIGDFLTSRPPFGIIRQERLEADLASVFNKLNLSTSKRIVNDPVKSHKNDYSGAPDLSALAVANLERCYALDMELYSQCCEWIAYHQNQTE